MTFRAKIFWVYTLTLLVSIGLIAVGVTFLVRQTLANLNRQNTDAFVAQFQREFERQEQDVVNRVQAVADDVGTTQMAVALSQPQADVSRYVNDGRGVAQSHQLDFLDFTQGDGAIISSAEWPARFGYKLDWLAQPEDWTAIRSFLMRVDTEDGPALGVMAVSTVRVGDKNFYVFGGQRLGTGFLASLVLPPGMRSMLYLNLDPTAFQPANLLDSQGPVADADRFSPFIEQERGHPQDESFKIAWTADPANAEMFNVHALTGRKNDLLGLLLVGSSLHDAVMLERGIRLLALAVVASGLFFGMLVSWWVSARVTRPVRKLAEGAREVSEGNWGVRVDAGGRDEIGQLAGAFNRMTSQLAEQRERLVQAERVAAWRELARRLAHELRNPLFPLQTTVENLQRAKEQSPGQFDSVFQESTGILLSEISNLKNITARFSDFAKMPQPELGPVNLNDVVRGVVKVFEAQFSAVGRPPITPELHLDESLPVIQADANLLHRAVENLVLNAMDAMPAGGVLMLRTTHKDGEVHLEVSDTGAGLTPEECERLFTPYYTTKQHGTGLGLAIVQSVVSDHGGRVYVESESGVGSTFHILLPCRPPARPVAPSPERSAGA